MTRRRTPLPCCVVFVLSAIVAGSPHPASAAPLLPCGQQPKIDSAELTERVEGDARDKADLIRKAEPDPGLRALVGTQRLDLRQKYASVEASALDSSLLWAICQAISKDPTQGTTQKFDEYSKLYRLLTEPIRGAAHTE
ncbi:MAG TPA: hypothetical protein VGM32_07175 [Rhodopila sp.]